MKPSAQVLALRSRLEARFGLTLASVGDEQLLRALNEAGGGEDLLRLADHLPISESSLMRDPEVWSWLDAEQLVPALRAAMARQRPLRVLSLGCSEGQEVFSLAITVLGVLQRLGLEPGRARDFVELVGVDISGARVERARSGWMAEWSVRGTPSPQAAAWLHKVEGGWQLDPVALGMCRFEPGNLLTLPSEVLGSFDLLLCRHVLIYFDPQPARAAVERLLASLQPGAHLILAPVEAHLLTGLDGLEPVGPVGVARVRTAGQVRPAPGPGPSAATALPASPATEHAAAAEAHRARALHAAEEGQLHQALSLARAATFLQPEHLGGRFLLARLQLRVEPALGRRMLQAVLDEARRSTGVDPELSNHQLVLAASALLGEQR